MATPVLNPGGGVVPYHDISPSSWYWVNTVDSTAHITLPFIENRLLMNPNYMNTCSIVGSANTIAILEDVGA